ncbi:hypothetical protein BJV82DRAFT_717394 [Fennellomyces sp. T-0311]|nr:hypothetical protein BJV82DRAFT_717394 [Fennellomyces sp. T-0311]
MITGVLLSLLLALLVPCVLADDGTPAYVFAIIIILPIVAVIAVVYFVTRYLRRDKPVLPAATTKPSITYTSSEEKKTNHHQSIEIERCCSEESEAPPPTMPTKYEDFKITLPLPPASTSLFSDKLELSSDEATELYKKYMNGDGIVSIDAHHTQKQRFSLQQKAATLKSTLRQSLRRQRSSKQSSSSTTPLRDLFDRPPSRRSSMESRIPPVSPKTPDTPLTPLTPPPPPALPPFAAEKVAVDNFYPRKSFEPDSRPFDPEPIRITRKPVIVEPVVDKPEVVDVAPVAMATTLSPEPIFSEAMEPVAMVHSQSVTRDSISREPSIARESFAMEHVDREPIIRKQPSPEPEQKPTSSAETEAHKIIQFASTRSKRRSFLADLQRNAEGKLSPSSSNSDFSRSSPSVQDIISWWQKESSLKSSQSNNSLTTPSIMQQEEPPIEERNTPKVSPPPSVHNPLSRQSSAVRPASSLFSGMNGSPRASLGSLSRLSAAERMMIVGNSSISSNTSNVNSVRRTLQETWSSDHSNSSSANSSVASRHHHMLSIRGQHNFQQRPAMPAGFMDEEGPMPTASFSSSTVRTMIPEGEYQDNKEQQKPKQQPKAQQGSFSRSNPINQRQSITLKPKPAPKPAGPPATTVRGGRKQQRGGIPWMSGQSSTDKTPAQREKDRYLQSLK